jgi:hypothetical protein
MEGVGSTEEALLLPAVRCGALPNPSSDIKLRFPETDVTSALQRPASAGSG